MQIYKILVFFLLSLWLHSASAQSKKGGIFLVFFQMEDSLSNYTHDMTPEILDSIKKVTRERLSEVLNAEVDFIYKYKKSGKRIYNAAVFGMIDSMPWNNYKNSRKNYDLDLYIKLDITISPKGGSAIALPSGKVSDIQPRITMSAIAYDRHRKVIWKKEISRGDFGDIRSQAKAKRYKRKGVFTILNRDENPNSIEPAEMLYMYRKLLEYL